MVTGPQGIPALSSDPTGENSWSVWGKHVLSEQERQNNVIELLRTELQKVNVEVATLKVKSGAIGFLGGLVPVLIAVGIALIIYLVKK